MYKISPTLILSLLLIITKPVAAEVSLPSIISSHMVLQQKANVKLWGWCDPAEKLTVKCDWDTTTYNALGSSGSNWEVNIKTPSAGGSHKIFIKGNNIIVLEDVVFGEVWLCGGQSNMQMSLSWGMPEYTEDAVHADNDSIRFFYVPKRTSNYPQEDVKAKWVVSTPAEMKQFSAAGYFFGKRLIEQLHVPVGLISANWGGTPAEVWTPAGIVEEDKILKTAAAQLKPSGWWPVAPGLCFNAMIYPISNYNIAGVIWYQGEANVGTWSTYQSLFTNMISSWRKQWKIEFPFYFVQIAPFAGYGSGNSAALLREAQTKSALYPNTGMVLTSDLVNDINDIHPKKKKEVGLRLANYALTQTYGIKDIAYKSPQYKEMKIEKDKARIYFDMGNERLMQKGEKLTDFYIAGEDKLFLPAQARIEKNTVIVWNKDIKHPVAVRFGFTNDAMPNLFSLEGLPVNIFRTDDWDVDTIKK